jgi:hypothetical protein
MYTISSSISLPVNSTLEPGDVTMPSGSAT